MQRNLAHAWSVVPRKAMQILQQTARTYCGLNSWQYRLKYGQVPESNSYFMTTYLNPETDDESLVSSDNRLRRTRMKQYLVCVAVESLEVDQTTVEQVDGDVHGHLKVYLH